FGAVQDEKMGEEVKITVIATGFREQMPERRKRMMEVVEAPVISIPISPAPVAQISLVSRNEGSREPAPAPVLTPKPPRFLSQEDEDEEESVAQNKVETASNPGKWDEDGFFSEPTTAKESAAAAEPPAETAMAAEPEETEWETTPAPPRFAELAEEPAYTQSPRDYYPAYPSGARNRPAQDDYRAQPGAMLFPETNEEAQPDLEKPTILRNLQL
ncbi:MAG TPA: hypothetical protein VKF63_06635, partial [Terracidiphilus sp.]|nr:hypothetical protein [Terracidiphilus sp.]